MEAMVEGSESGTAATGGPSAAVAVGLAVVCTLLSVVGLTFEFLTRSTPFTVDFGSRASTTATAVVFMALPIVGALVARRRPDNPIGWLFIAIGATMAIWVFADGLAIYSLRTHPGSFAGGTALAWLASWVWVVGWTLTGIAFLVFPTGRLLSRRWRLAVGLLVVVGAGVVLSTALADGHFENYRFADNPLGTIRFGFSLYTLKVIDVLALAVAGVPAVASLIVRARRAGTEERQQIKWVTWAAAVTVFVILGFTIVRALGARVDWLESVVLSVGILVPVSAGFAVLKYRLYGIDLVINKTVVFGVLAVFVTAVYVAVVVGLGALLGLSNDPKPGLSIISTALVAVAFEPVRLRAQRLANRIVYGDRATPYEALSALSASMASTSDADETLPQLAAVIGEGLGAERTAVWLKLDGSLHPAASWPPNEERPEAILAIRDDQVPTDHGDARFFPVRHQEELLGALSVEMVHGDHLDPARTKLVVDLSRQAGLVLRNIRLITELRTSRHRIVTAGDAERRRLERDLHDGAQQQLVALAIKLGLVERMLDGDPDGARSLLDELRHDANDALGNLRDLARGIYPPLLADAGLVRALEAQSAKSIVPVTVQAFGVERYAQDVEIAVYFCCLEAVQNVGKYAPDASMTIELAWTDGLLRFVAADDGPGFDPHAAGGSGLQNMADRLAALDGQLEIRSAPGRGTTITGRLPAERVIDLDAVDPSVAEPAMPGRTAPNATS
jgi:signal transduction histidine kinase